ncbi:MAG TPA: M20/M25/M40 family metallo-hydrolase [Thermoanaerobaculia bacterium]|nr:M20/M25/M40 family metallo-hydrolase [Thermoanaerobaculia bacterium]
MIRRLTILLFLAAVLPARAATLADETQAFLNVIAVSGREEDAAQFILTRLGGLSTTRDGFGNVVLTVGSGEPRRLVACALGEPGFLVTGIEEDGWVRVVPAGDDIPVGALWTQSYEGNVVRVGGERGWIPGAVAVRSVHLMQEGGPPEKPLTPEGMYIDVGAESAAEAVALGVRLLDPVALIRRPVRLAGDLLAGPSAAQKAACVAVAEAARRTSRSPGPGTAVFAWTTNDHLNGAGLAHLLRDQAPFEEVILLRPGFGWEQQEDGRDVFRPLPLPGIGILGAGSLSPEIRELTAAPHLDRLGSAFGPDRPWSSARVGYLGVPARYPGTPVETISLRDVKALSDALVQAVRGDTAAAAEAPPLSPAPIPTETGGGHEEAARLLGTLVERYGVSGAEGPVREEILRHLPAWAKPEIDGKANVSVTFGSGDEHVLFVAHMDEVGFRVEEILPDGRLRLQPRGGLLRSVWEAQAALVHGERGPVPAVFEPREDWWTADKWAHSGSLTAYLGVSSAKQAEALGVRVGSTATMPKKMDRMGPHRVLGRSFDDRVGSTALVLALRRIDPAKLGKRVTFAWVVEEEVGLHGSRALAERLPDLTAVHPVDTFVSSDSPIESSRFARTRLGQGVVLRGMDNGFLAPRELIARYAALAEGNGLPVQVGFTGGATDGMAFLAGVPVMLPFSWPGRYSHSPVEVADLRDLETLVEMIVAVATEDAATPGSTP